MMFGREFGNWNHNGWFGSRFFYSGWEMLIVAVLIIAIVVAVVYLLKRNKPQKKDNDALQVLQMRYANGEISEEEYEQKKKRLQE